MNADAYIKKLQLTPHPEGGHFKETYRSEENISLDCLPEKFTGKRGFSTAIYYLLQAGERSVFHRLKSDECWHFYAGNKLLIHVIDKSGNYECIRLGSDLDEGDLFQYVVTSNKWFAAEPAPGSEFSLAGCTVAPGFHFDDFEIARKTDMLKDYPQHQAIIAKLCH